MKSTVMNRVKSFTLVALGLLIGAMGIYVGEADDAPGAGGIGLILMVTAVVLGVKAARNRLPLWAARTALAAGIVLAVLAALLTHGVVVTRPLFAESQQVPSTVASVVAQPHTASVERARQLVRAAVLAQNLPGVSVAVGSAGAILWAEGFGWRDVETRAAVTPDTRFNIGTAAAAVAASVAPLGLANTGAEAAKEWSPEAIGEEGEDFPLFTIFRHVVWQPLGLMRSEYPLPGDRATFYVPRADHNPRRGRRLMYMRDLACCANGMAFYSTPSDLVRFALATQPASVNGELAGGLVTSMTTAKGSGIAVAVSSNMAYANTSSLAEQVRDAFIGQAR